MQSVLSETVERLRARREAVRADHLAGAPGLVTVEALSDSVDEAVRSAWQEAGPPEGAVLIALGEYGRRELAPAAEADLMVLRLRQVPGSDPVSAATFVCNELYSAGIEADYRVHTPEESLGVAASSIESETAFLDARLIAGDTAPFEDWMSSLLAQVRRTSPPFVERLQEAAGHRHFQMDEATACLEPDLKEGKGGLQDLAAIGWIRMVNQQEVQELPVAVSVLEEAAGFLHRVRAAVHYFTGRNTDLLQMDYQKSVAEALSGGEAEPGTEVALMKSLYEKCRPVAFALDVWLQDTSDTGEAARFTESIGSGPVGRWPEGALPAFIEVLSSVPDCRPSLRVLDHSGALVRAIPEWEAIRCLPQRNIYHRFAVDFHLFETVYQLSRLGDNPDEVVRTTNEQILAEDRSSLLVAALLHDIGKGDPSGDHAVTGEQIARKATDRMGIEEQAASEIAWLVGNHLVLAETATQRDIGDEQLVADLAGRVGSARRLRMLYLLTVADALATGPEAWSTWKGTLVRRLFERSDHLLDRGAHPDDNGRRQAEARAQELKSALPEYRGIEEHVAKMPPEWISSQSLSALVKQSRLMMDFNEADEIFVEASADNEAGVCEVIVVARDRPGLFSKVAGSLALHDLSVVGARVFTSDDGIALEVIRVTALSDEEDRFEHVARDARKALHGKVALDARLADKRLGGPDRPSRGKQEPTRIVVDNEASHVFTVIEVHASDRIGRLYDITRALAELELDIHIAKVSTYAEDIVDVFYITDLDRRKVTEAEYLAEIEKAILHRL